jgi:hypothetical protein
MTQEYLDVKKWVLEGPTPPTIVVNTLKEAKVEAYYLPKINGGSASITSGEIFIKSTFAKLPLVKKILEDAGITRKRWPRPRPWTRQRWSRSKVIPSRQKFRLSVRYNVRGPVNSSRLRIRLTPEQGLNLTVYATRTGQTFQQAAQRLFKNALALHSI